MNTAPLHLKQTQRLLWQCITAPEGVAQVVRARPGLVLPIHGDARLSAIERVDIYANMYFFRILDSLKEDFPAVLRVIGDARFHNLVTDYLLKFPSRHWSLRYVGERLPGFLATHATRRQWPFLAALARMEWVLITAFDAPDCAVLTRERMAAHAPATWGALPLALIPSCQLGVYPWPVDRVRERVLGGSQVAEIIRVSQNAARVEGGASTPQARARRFTAAKERTPLIVWRQGFDVVYRRATPAEFRLLQIVARGVGFATLCDRVVRRAGAAKATRVVAQYFQQWLQDGLLVDDS